MNKNVISALILIGLSVLVLLVTRDSSVTVDLLFTTIRPSAPLAFFAFIADGVVIGLLLK
jgi:hypothetical protein